MDLLRAARDDQLKVILPDTKNFILTNLPATAERWAEKNLLG